MITPPCVALTIVKLVSWCLPDCRVTLGEHAGRTTFLTEQFTKNASSRPACGAADVSGLTIDIQVPTRAAGLGDKQRSP